MLSRLSTGPKNVWLIGIDIFDRTYCSLGRRGIVFDCKGYLGRQIKDSEDNVSWTLGGELPWPVMLVRGAAYLNIA